MNYRYQIFLNETYDPTREYSHFDGYVPGAHMEQVYSGTVTGDEDIPGSVRCRRQVLEDLFETFNIAHPADYANRSVSVGDIIVIIDEECWATAYACENIGWKVVDNFDPEVKNPLWTDYRSRKAGC